MGIGYDSVGQSYNMLFKNKTLLVLAVVGAVISAIATLAFTAPLLTLQTTAPGALASILSPGFLVSLIIGLLVISLISTFISATIISAASMGDKAEIASAVKMGASRYISLIGTSIACAFVGLVGFIPGIALLAAGSLGIGGAIAVILGIVLMVVPGMYIVLRLSLADAACVAGGKKAIAAVKNSFAITKGNLWSIIAIVIALSIIDGIAGGIVSYVNTPVGSFVNTFFAYPVTIAFVLIYKQLSKGK